jgi:MFS family permease
MSTPEQPFRWSSVAVPVFLPTVLFATGEGAIIPVIPQIVASEGGTLAIAGLVAGMLQIGTLVGDIPSGWVISRIGERLAMIGSSVIALIAMLACVAAPTPLVLGGGVLLLGIAATAFALARHSFMTQRVPLRVRARALSTLGGSFRLGLLIGPFLGALIIELSGSAHAVFWVQAVAALACIVLLVALRDPETGTRGLGLGALAARRPSRRTATFSSASSSERGAGADDDPRPASPGLFRTLAARRDVLLRLGWGVLLMGALRASRLTLLPLWAVSLGIGERDAALIIGIGAAIDFGLFFTSGWIMDRFGRAWSAVPAMTGLGLGHLVLAFTHDIGGAAWWFGAVTLFLALANGIGSGIMMTVGADLADPRDPAPFLGAWRFITDGGTAAAPLVIAGVTATVSLAAASGVMGVLGLVGGLVFLRYLPRYASGPGGR